MISNSTRSPPKIRLKKNSMEMYESIFRNNLNTSIKPMNPPPFALTKAKSRRMPSESIQESTSDQYAITPNSVAQVHDVKKAPKEDTHDAAILLASMKNLTAKEAEHTSTNTNTNTNTKPMIIALPSIPDIEKHFERGGGTNTVTVRGAITNSFMGTHTPTKLHSSDYSRLRTVSMDSVAPSKGVEHIGEVVKSVRQVTRILPAISTAFHTVPIEPSVLVPKSPRGVDRRKRYLDDHTQDLSPSKEQAPEVDDSSKPEAKKQKTTKASRPLIEKKVAKKSPKRTKATLRKKFSWKNYPELENFLIKNREEYLRHSALNYTMQQKQYNNCLTERLIELAADCGYVFDEEAFTFVSIRDRIRCYFKSYVQSRKKRGVIIGYAARKAGLLSEKELEKNASTKAKNSIKRSKK